MAYSEGLECLSGLSFLDIGIGIVIVDGFEILCFNGEPGDVGIKTQPGGHLPNDIFHEHGVVIGPLGHKLFVGSFQDGKDFGACTLFDQVDEVFHPDELPKPDMHSDNATLIMSARLTNLLGTWADGGNGNRDAEVEILSLIARTTEPADILHETLGSAYGRPLFDEVGEFHLEVGGLGMEFLLHLIENLGECFHGDLSTVFVKNFHESAHMGSSEPMRKINVHVDVGYGVLESLGLV